MIEVLEHAFKDSFYMLPFLFVAYILIEYIEQSSSDKLQKLVKRFGRFGPFGGALLGCIPQCGFSTATANFYSNRIVTLGTLIAVFLSTSDEAVAVLIMYPEQLGTILKLIGAKIAVASVAGFAVDFIFKSSPDIYINAIHSKHERCHEHGGGVKSVLLSATKHTVGTYLLIFATTAVLDMAIEWLGETNLAHFLMSGAWYQPFVAALVGFLPNCAVSVLLAQLYVSGVLKFGSLLAGLCTGAGVGLVVLFKENRRLKENLKIMCIMYIVAVVVGLLF